MNKNSKKILQASTGVAVAAAISILSIAPAHADEVPVDETVIAEFDATPAEAPVVTETEVPAVEDEAPVTLDEAPVVESLVEEAPAEVEETPVTEIEPPAIESLEAPAETEVPAVEPEAPAETEVPAEDTNAGAEEEAPSDEAPAEETEDQVVIPSAPSVNAEQDGWYGIIVGWGGDEGVELYTITLTNAFTGEAQEITSSEAGAHTFTDLAAGATYEVAVTAQNSAGVSEAGTTTVELSVGTPAEPKINKSRYNYEGIGYTSYDFQVDGSDSTGAVEGYRVTVTNAELGYSQSVELGRDGGRPLFTGLVPSTTYQISATAFGPGGETTVNDRFVSLIAMPADAPSVSTGETTSDSVPVIVEGATVTPALGLPEAGLEVTSYDVTIEGAGTSATQSITEPGTVTFSELQADTEYTITVIANNIAGAGEASVLTARTQVAEATNPGTEEDDQNTENPGTDEQNPGTDEQNTENQDEETNPGDTGLRDDSVPEENQNNDAEGNGNAKATEPDASANDDNSNNLVPTGGSSSGTTGVIGGALIALGAAFVALRRKVFGNI